jgi:serine/threonine protein kinase
VDGTPFGRYRLIELLGRGGMGEVWRAHDSTIDRVVALKMLLPHFAEDPTFEQRFRREARAAARLDNPHVVPIYDVGELDGRLYVTMRLITGTDLQTLLDAGPLAAERAVTIVEQIASALHNAHQAGLVHRDVKPSNILLDNEDFAYLIDFGIARAADETGLTSEGAAIGTWAYMAPERFRGGQLEPSSDVYALACVLYQCLTGETPYPGSTLEHIAVGHMFVPPPRASEERPTVPVDLDDVIATGLAKQPQDRYPTTIQMAAAARQAITNPARPRPTDLPRATVTRRSDPRVDVASDGGDSQPPRFPTSGPPGPSAPPPTRPERRRPSRVLIGALATVAVLVIAVGALAAVTLTRPAGHTDTPPAGETVAGGTNFTGTYRADYGPGTDLEGKPVAGAPATTTTWGVRSTCGSGGCVAAASVIGGSGLVLLSNLVFDQVGGSWVAVGLASADCTNGPAEYWVLFTLQPQPDGTLSGESTRATTNAGCDAKRTVKFTRTGDPDLNRVPDPSVLPPRTTSPASALHGKYHESLVFANGNVVSGQDDLAVRTECLRTGERCISLFHAPDGVVTLIFADGKWTRSESGAATCTQGGTAEMSVTAVYPLPTQLEDPIPVLTGHGTQTVAPGGACPGGGDFVDTYERTGD